MRSVKKGATAPQVGKRPFLLLANLALVSQFLLITALSAQAETLSSETAKNQLLATYGRLPQSFEANYGQSDAQVKFLSRGRGYSLFLTSSEAVLVLRKADGARRQAAEKTASALSPQRSELSSVVHMKLAGANPHPQVAGVEELPGKVNYFIGNHSSKWRTNIPTYAKVKYQEVYPGVDVVYYGNQGQLEYDLVVAPGADPSVIKLAFEGVEKITTDSKGALLLRTASGDLRMHKPLVYQEIAGGKQEIPGNYVLNLKSEIENPKWEVGFQLASYDASKPLFIDPVLVYSTYLGGSGNDSGNGIAVDGSGNAYVVGSTGSTSFSVTPVDFGPGGGTDVFVAKLDSTGSALAYLTFIGGSTEDQGLGIALDASGSAYITGRTNSSNFPTTAANAVQTSKSGSAATFDAFVTKLNAAGSALLYSTYLGGSQDESGNGIAVDSTGKAYVVGQTKSTNFPIKNAFRGKNGGATDVFVAKLDPSQVGAASLIFATYLGGSGDDNGNGIAVDNAGNAYVAGTTASTNFPTTAGVLDRSCGTDPKGTCNGGLSDAFVFKLNDSGSALIYSTYLGGAGSDAGNGIALDASSNAYVTGSTTSTNFPTTTGVFDASNNGLSDAFVAKLSANGSTLVYSTYLGGSGDDTANAIAVDGSGNAYVTGRTSSSNFPVAGGAFQSALAPGDSGGDAFVTKLNPTGSALVYSTYLGGSGADEGRNIAVDLSLNAYVTGFTSSSTGFPIASFQPAFGGGTFDAFATKLHEQPVANNDSYAIPEDSLGLVESAPGVLGNDSGSPLSAILVSSPTNGKLTLNSNGSFTYTPAANFNGIDSFTYKANDGLADSNQATVTITVTPVNDPPVLSTNAGFAVNEGGSGTITNAQLQVTDIDNTPAQIIYTVTVLPTNGSLRKSGTAVSLSGTFTQADINSSIITYQHNGSETLSDSFTFTVSDGAGGTIGATVFNITVTPVNDAPVLAINAGLTVNEGATGTIGNTRLQVTDVDNTPAQIVYTVTVLPTNGSLRKNGAAVSLNGTFTQADINSSVITYQHNGSETISDSFSFSVSDGAGGTIGATVFNITVNAVNDKPLASANPASLTIDEDAAPTTLALSGSDAETAAAALTFTITQAPANGTLKKDLITLLLGSTFTGSPTDVTYQPNGNFNGSDSFKFKVTDTGDGSSAALDSNEVTVAITVTAVNDPPFFDLIADQYPNTDPFVAQTLVVDITGVSAGPADEVAGQTVALAATVTSSNPAGLVTIVNNPLLGTDSTRTLSYQIPANTTGTATIRVTANDGQSANNSFIRDIAVTVQAAGTPPPALAALTGLTLGSAFVKYQVTFNPVDLNGDGTINSFDCYSVFPPQPQDNPYNLFPSNALVTPEAPPAVVADTYDTTGFGTTQICATPRSFAGVIDLSVWGITDLGGKTIDFTYVNFVKDPELVAVIGGNADCGAGATTCQNVLIGSFPAGSIAFTFGGTVAEKNTVLLHSVELQSGFSTKKPLAHVEARVFDRNDRAFQNQRFNGTRVGQNPSGSLYGAIFESGVGMIVDCDTDASGICLTTETQPGSYLVVIKFVDSANNKIVYEGQTMVASDFVDTSVPPDGTGDFAEATFEIIRKNRDGTFQEYQGGAKTVVCDLSSPGCIPQ